MLTKEVSTPLQVPNTPKIPDNKLVFTIHIKHFVYLMQNLTKRFAGEKKLLEASEGAIMGFIIRHLCDENYNSFSIKDLKPYFKEGTEPLNMVLKWNGDGKGLANICVELNLFPEKEASYITSPPEKIIKIVIQNFHSKNGEFFKKVTFNQSMKPSVQEIASDKNKFNVKELMNLNA